MNISEINKESVEQRIKFILIFSIFIAMLGFLTDFENTLKYGGADLRTRVVGARFLINRFDPYSSKWNDDLSDFYLDPGDHKYSPVNKVLDTPTILFIHSLFAKIPYKLQRIIWFIFQWIFLVLTLFLFANSTGSKNRSKLIWIIGLFFISGSSFWRLHVEKGQIYILYIFLITLTFWLSQRISKNSGIFSGILLGLTASLYFPIIVMYIPMFIFKKWKLFIGNICGLLSGLSISILITDLRLWKSYISSMSIHVKMYLGLIDYYELYSKFDAEGMKNFYPASVIPPFDSSLHKVIKNFFGIHLSLNTSIVFLSIFIILCIFLLYKYRNKNISNNLIFLIGITLVYIIEFLIPLERFSYKNIIWIIPLSLIIANYDLIELLSKPISILLAIGLIFSVSFHLLPLSHLMNNYCMLIYLVWTVFYVLPKDI